MAALSEEGKSAVAAKSVVPLAEEKLAVAATSVVPLAVVKSRRRNRCRRW